MAALIYGFNSSGFTRRGDVSEAVAYKMQQKCFVVVKNLFVCLLYLFNFVNCSSCFLIKVMFFCILYCHF